MSVLAKLCMCVAAVYFLGIRNGEFNNENDLQGGGNCKGAQGLMDCNQAGHEDMECVFDHYAGPVPGFLNVADPGYTIDCAAFNWNCSPAGEYITPDDSDCTPNLEPGGIGIAGPE